MSNIHRFNIDDNWILDKRGNKNSVSRHKPYGWLVEKERTLSGKIEDTAIIFLTNRECPFRCLMCDLWKNTTDLPVAKGDIPKQIEWALEQVPPAKHLKLYNSGSFFDGGAIPQSDYQKIAETVKNFDTVIVESHTRFINQRCLQFRDLLKPELEVAVGLETVHPEILSKLNKKMNRADFEKSIRFLTKNNIRSRAFVLLGLPFITETESIEWAKKSIDFAFDCGVDYCTVIPTRIGNGALDFLRTNGDFSQPDIKSLEAVLEYGITKHEGLVFADTWDLELFSKCSSCTHQRTERINSMNLNQGIEKQVICNCD